MKTTTTPFHKGELALQERLGVKDMVGNYAPRVIRDHMPNQHRDFFSTLPYFMLGSVDTDGQPWASMLWGEPGFVASPNAKTLAVHAVPGAGDPLNENLKSGAEIGMVGIEFHSRRRNRVNGRVTETSELGFSVEVTQSFGNCPQYIQVRGISEMRRQENKLNFVTTGKKLSQGDEALIVQADTFFIASASGSLGADERHGVDVSHRGGAPGFVKILDDGSLLVPDFSGNNHFNTLGNIAENPIAGLLFADFKSGDILQLSGAAEIVWPAQSLFHYEGALRYLRIEPKGIVRRKAAIPYVWDTPNMSPFLSKSEWLAAPNVQAAPGNEQLQYRIEDIITEAKGIKSFYLKPVHGDAVPTFEPGQHLPIVVTVGGKKLRRTYSLSASPGKAMLRLTIKRDPRGTVSRHIHDNVAIGQSLTASRPGGAFTLQEQRDRPIALISAGVGITPMMAMAETILAEGTSAPEIFFIHGSKTPADVPFLTDLRRWDREHERFSLKFCFSGIPATSLSGFSSYSLGHIDANYLKNSNISNDSDYYLCGPSAFMQGTYNHLIETGIPEKRIFFEAFGPSSLVRKTSKPAKTYAPQQVKFKRSGIETTWDLTKDTLLETTENQGIEAPFSCRSGSCGTCITPLLKGRVSYETPPPYPVDDKHVLLCCAVPAKAENGGEMDQTLVLDL